MLEIKPPNEIPKDKDRIIIFAAGSIESGKAEPWQEKLVESLTEYDITILNPRRSNWDNSWKQRMSDPNFNIQVNWEMDGLDISDIIVMYFDPETKSPISLLELGLTNC